jgi:hypothetical protein
MKRLELCDDPAAREYLRYTNAQMMNGGFNYQVRCALASAGQGPSQWRPECLVLARGAMQTTGRRPNQPAAVLPAPLPKVMFEGLAQSLKQYRHWIAEERRVSSDPVQHQAFLKVGLVVWWLWLGGRSCGGGSGCDANLCAAQADVPQGVAALFAHPLCVLPCRPPMPPTPAVVPCTQAFRESWSGSALGAIDMGRLSQMASPEVVARAQKDPEFYKVCGRVLWWVSRAVPRLLCSRDGVTDGVSTRLTARQHQPNPQHCCGTHNHRPSRRSVRTPAA